MDFVNYRLSCEIKLAGLVIWSQHNASNDCLLVFLFISIEICVTWKLSTADLKYFNLSHPIINKIEKNHWRLQSIVSVVSLWENLVLLMVLTDEEIAGKKSWFKVYQFLPKATFFILHAKGLISLCVVKAPPFLSILYPSLDENIDNDFCCIETK